ncbi:MAG: nucleotidyltransferase family protein [Ignisphaera sp.]
MAKIIAAILAGGEGTRFRPYTDIIPKPMIPIGPEEKPILEYIIKWLRKYNVSDIVLLVGYKWKQIRNYFGTGSRFNVNIAYSVDTEVYRGTGGAILNAYKKGLLNGEVVLIWYGDILAPVNVTELIFSHIEKNADAVIVLADRYKVPVGVAKVEGDKIIDFEEKPWVNIYVSLAILTLSIRILDEVEKNLGKNFDIMGDLIPWMISRNLNVYAYIYKGAWYDIGSLDQYKKLDLNLVKEFIQD